MLGMGCCMAVRLTEGSESELIVAGALLALFGALLGPVLGK